MTKLSRRRFMHFAAAAAGLPTVASSAWAQTYPSRPVRVIVGQAAGSGSDTVARLIGQYLSERLGQQFVVENPYGQNIGPGLPWPLTLSLDGNKIP
jgi:tripartite-type tricarboxylate transporter receptor subunit TctC